MKRRSRSIVPRLIWIEVLPDDDNEVFEAEKVVPLIDQALRENFIFKRDIVKVDVRISYVPGRKVDDV
tara:strand:+ start:886 stop:1089 length:204 start_codon:yes stop_codon:yes gene_type:complete